MSIKLLLISLASIASIILACPANAQFWRTLNEINGASNTLRNAAGAIDYTTDTLSESELEQIQNENVKLRQQIHNQQLRNRLIEENQRYQQQLQESNSPESEKGNDSIELVAPLIRQLASNEANQLYSQGVRSLDTLVALVPAQVKAKLEIQGDLSPAYRDSIMEGVMEFWKQLPSLGNSSDSSQ